MDTRPVAGVEYYIQDGQLTLDGTSSSDPDSVGGVDWIETYDWTFMEGPVELELRSVSHPLPLFAKSRILANLCKYSNNFL